MSRLPWFERTPESPALPGEGEALVLSVPPSAPWAEPASLVVSGAFQIGESLEGLANGDPFAALTVFVVEGATQRSFAVRPMADGVGLATEPGPAGTQRGWFTADVFAMAKREANPGTYYVSAYLGALQCAPVAVPIVGAPAARRA